MTPRPRRTSHALPSAPYVPGQGPDPRYVDGWVEVEAGERFAWGSDLFDAGFYWEAHEVWEARWRDLPEGSEAARHQQGLLLVAAALHKHAVGTDDGAATLIAQARRVLDRLAQDRGPIVAGLDVAELLGATEVALRGGDPPAMGEAVGLTPPAASLALAPPDTAPSWPEWVEDWVLPYIAEPALLPVLLALLGHVVVVIAPLVLALVRTGSGYAAAGLLALAVGSAVAVRWELKVHRAPSGVTATVVGTWAVSLLAAWGADRLGVL